MEELISVDNQLKDLFCHFKNWRYLCNFQFMRKNSCAQQQIKNTFVRFLFFSLLPTLCAPSTEIFSNCSFSSNKFCKISSVCSHVSFSTSAIPSILRLSRRDLSSRSLSLSQSWSLSFQSSLMSSLCFCFCLLRLSSTF